LTRRWKLPVCCRSEVFLMMHKKFFVNDERYRLRSNLDGDGSEVDSPEPVNVT